jgi:hypothetical protein
LAAGRGEDQSPGRRPRAGGGGARHAAVWVAHARVRGGGGARADLAQWWSRLGPAWLDLGLLGHGFAVVLWWLATAGPGRLRVWWFELVDLWSSWLPYAGAAALGQEVVTRFFGCMGSKEFGGGRPRSSEVGSEVSDNVLGRGAGRCG